MERPIPPEEVETAKKRSIPDEVIAAFNFLIVERWDGHSSKVFQSEVVSEIIQRSPKILEHFDYWKSKEYIYMHKWLNVEDIFRGVGWEVKYDKPGYCESSSAFFEFSKSEK